MKHSHDCESQIRQGKLTADDAPANVKLRTTIGSVFSPWRHQMETYSALLALCAGNSPVSGESPAQRPVTRSFGVFIDPRLNKRLSKQSGGWWFETLSRVTVIYISECENGFIVNWTSLIQMTAYRLIPSNAVHVIEFWRNYVWNCLWW